MNKQEIGLDERRKIQIEMLDEIDSFCRNKGILYSLAYGTLLGAIRHKGFIPWDDDMDIMMPLPDMLRFKNEFKSKKLKYCDVDTERNFEYTFSRIVHKQTYSLKGLNCKSYGINIDLYPIIPLPDSLVEQKEYFDTAIRLNENRRKYMKWRKRIISRFPISTIPGFEKSIRECRNFELFTNTEYGSTHCYYVNAGPYSRKDKMLYDFDLFKTIIEVQFEGHLYCAIANYHEFMTQCYGDYMQFPPEDQRHPYHGEHYYWR